MYYMRGKKPTAKAKVDIAASFQAAAIDVLVTKTMRAVEEHKAKSILLGGGVAANSLLRKTLQAEAKKADIEFHVSERKYSGDNAAMIAASAYIDKMKGKKFRITAQASLNL